jgi:hypothetical protein
MSFFPSRNQWKWIGVSWDLKALQILPYMLCTFFSHQLPQDMFCGSQDQNSSSSAICIGLPWVSNWPPVSCEGFTLTSSHQHFNRKSSWSAYLLPGQVCCLLDTLVSFVFWLFYLPYTNNMRVFNCDNSINLHSVPWTSSLVPLHS